MNSILCCHLWILYEFNQKFRSHLTCTSLNPNYKDKNDRWWEEVGSVRRTSINKLKYCNFWAPEVDKCYLHGPCRRRLLVIELGSSCTRWLLVIELGSSGRAMWSFAAAYELVTCGTSVSYLVRGKKVCGASKQAGQKIMRQFSLSVPNCWCQSHFNWMPWIFSHN